jgi:hypothetical protein
VLLALWDRHSPEHATNDGCLVPPAR